MSVIKKLKIEVITKISLCFLISNLFSSVFSFLKCFIADIVKKIEIKIHPKLKIAISGSLEINSLLLLSIDKNIKLIKNLINPIILLTITFFSINFILLFRIL